LMALVVVVVFYLNRNQKELITKYD